MLKRKNDDKALCTTIRASKMHKKQKGESETGLGENERQRGIKKRRAAKEPAARDMTQKKVKDFKEDLSSQWVRARGALNTAGTWRIVSSSSRSKEIAKKFSTHVSRV